MNLYAETSALLTWLLDEPEQPLVDSELQRADLVVTSRLTWLECARALRRLGGSERQIEAERMARLRTYWTTIELSEPILQRAEEGFPVEPVRSLDGLHLASALAARDWIDGLQMLALDQRVRRNAASLGFVVLPRA